MSDYIHLHNHTHYSLLDGACSVEDLIGAAKANNMPAVALTDHGVMFGAYEFYNKAQKQGVKPILGCEAYIVSQGSRFDRQQIEDPSKKRKVYHHLILLAKNETGYRNLMKLVTAGYTEGFYYRPRIDTEILRRHSEGLVAMSACAGGVISPYLIANDYDKAKEVASVYKDIFDTDFYVEIQNHHLAAEEKVRALAPKLARELGLKLVCSNDCHYLKPEHAIAHNVLMLIKDTGKDDNPDITKLRYGTPEYYFRSENEMLALFKDFPEALESTVEIAEKCNLILPKDMKMPTFPIPEGIATLDEYLDKLTYEGIESRGLQLTSDVRERADFELSVIKKMGYSGYFLIVQDFIAEARKRGVRVGPGRGSAAGSIVAYALGITNVDPIRYNLLFERFLNPDRVSMPDIDIDFSDDKRDKVLSYVREKYGRESVAQIITFSTLSARAVLKDVGRVMGVPLNTIAELTSNIPVIMGRVTPLHEAMQLPEMKDVLAKYKQDEKVQKMLEYALVLEGFARAASKHAAGVVITPGDISNFVPLYQAPSETEPVTQFTMKDVEDAGLLKMDFLGLRTLSIIDTALAMIEQNHGTKIDIDNIPLDDKKTYDLFGRGDTIGVFQFDSTPMQNYMRALKPTSIEDLSSMNALYRPGPMEHIPEFIERKHGRKAVEYLHPKLEPILNETYGVIVVQEQVMRIARDLAGFSLAKADEMRRAMGKKDIAKMEAMKDVFLKGCVANEIPEKIAKELYDRLAKFASYGFNKSHSLAYSLIAYQTAWLKANYTAEFLAANMTHEMGSTDYIVQLIDEAKKFGIAVLPPDVNHSHVTFSATPTAIRFGLAGVKNVGEKALAGIVGEREKNGLFKSIFDFTSRVDSRAVNRRATESLIQAGAFDSTRPEGHPLKRFRSDLNASVEKALDYGSQAPEHDSLFGDVDASYRKEPPLVTADVVWTDDEVLTNERNVLGFYVSGHPLEKHRIDVQSFSSHTFAELDELKLDELVFVIGVIVGIERKLNKKGEAFAVVTIEDFTGKRECIFWGKEYRDFGALITIERPIAVSGRIKKNGTSETATIVASQAMSIEAVRSAKTRGVVIKLEANGEPPEKLIESLKSVIKRYEGNRTTYVVVENPTFGQSRKYMLPQAYKVTGDDDFVAEIESRFGKNKVLYCR